MKRRCAVFTIAHNEALFLPIWLRCMTSAFELEDVYVVDHGSTDGSIAKAREWGIRIAHLPPEGLMDPAFHAARVKDVFGSLLVDYDYVLYLDTDEIVITDPDCYLNVQAFLSTLDRDWVRFDSRSVVHHPDEPALNAEQPLLLQRGYWYCDPLFRKPVLSNRVLDWNVGQHHVWKPGDDRAARQIPYPSTEIAWGVILIHLNKVDVDMWTAKRKMWGMNTTATRQLWKQTLAIEEFRAPLTYCEPIPDRFKTRL